MTAAWVLGVICVLLLAALVTSLVFLYKCAKTVVAIVDAIQESLDILDDSYAKIGEILEIPVMSDEPFVKMVLSEISNSQRAILLVANKLTTGWDPSREPPGEEETEDE